MTHNQTPSVTLALHREGWKTVTTRAGLTTDMAQAAVLHLGRPHLNRVRNGRAVPGPEFIAAALKAFPDARFEELFTIVPKALAS